MLQALYNAKLLWMLFLFKKLKWDNFPKQGFETLFWKKM